jgi:hypothetical protein
VKLLKCYFLDTNRVFTLIGDGRKIFGVNRMPGCTSVEIGLIFGIDHIILRSPGPSHGSKFNKCYQDISYVLQSNRGYINAGLEGVVF